MSWVRGGREVSSTSCRNETDVRTETIRLGISRWGEWVVPVLQAACDVDSYRSRIAVGWADSDIASETELARALAAHGVVVVRDPPPPGRREAESPETD